MEVASRSIRRNALQKIAALAATSSASTFDGSDLNRLSRACVLPASSTGNGTSGGIGASLERQPMTIREFEVLIALCKAAPILRDEPKSAKLVSQLGPYMLEMHGQFFLPSPFFREIEPSPIEALSFNLSSALLSLGINHVSLQEGISSRFSIFLDNCAQALKTVILRQETMSDEKYVNETPLDIIGAISVARITISMLGFLDAAATYAHFWTALERISVIEQVKELISEHFLIAIESAFSTIRNSHQQDRLLKEWKRYMKHYAAVGRPLGAMLLQRSFVGLLVACSSLLVADASLLRGNDVLDLLLSSDENVPSVPSQYDEGAPETIEIIAGFAADEMNRLEDGEDFLQLGSAWQQRLAFAAKAGALTTYLNCSLLNEEVADVETLMTWLEDTLADPVQMADSALASVVLKCMALVGKISPLLAVTLSKLLPRFIVQGSPRGETVAIAASCLAYILRMLSQDAVITTLYTLGNILSSGTNAENALLGASIGETTTSNGNSNSQQLYGSTQATGSAISLTITGEEETFVVYSNIIRAICGVASSCHDEKITALAQSMLLQKITKVNKLVDTCIITESAKLAVCGGPLEFKSLLKMYSKVTQDGVASGNSVLLASVLKGRNYLSVNLRKGSQMYDIYLEHLLETIISRGDVYQGHHTRETDVELAAKEIGQMLQPLAVLMSTNNMAEDNDMNDEIISLIRDTWFNIVVHGITISTDRGQKYMNDLRVIAIHSKSLVTEQRAEQVESDIDLNTILRRGMNTEHEASQKRRLVSLLPSKSSEIKALSYRKVIFLQAAYLIETLRAESGDCTKVVTYFLEPGMRIGDTSNVMEGVTDAVMRTYLQKTLNGLNPIFSAPYVAKQLVSIFCGCCHRIERVQQAAIACAEKLIREVPSAMCQKPSLFALLELLSLMWTGCLEEETDEYEWKSSFSSSRGKVVIQLSDNYSSRRKTLNSLYKKAKVWVMLVTNIAPLDVKGLLQTYLSEYDDDGAYGHVSLGRSFATEMGGMIPSTDQKLGAIDRHGDCNINAASDFVAQYTTRQEYRHAETLPDHDAEWLNFVHFSGGRRGSLAEKMNRDVDDAETVLAHLEARTIQGNFIPVGELRDVLRRAAALLCRSKRDECAIIHHLVAIPFALFTKQSIKLGISLWLGVINENPRMEPRILMEIAQHWEKTIQRRQGVFHDTFMHPDPFYVKGEFAPSDRSTMLKRQQAAHNLLAPHSRLLQFLGSHFNSTRLGSPHTQRTFLRLLRSTLRGLNRSTGHPLAREIRLQMILFGLKILKYCTGLPAVGSWRLKNQILSGALSWFRFAPRWSFGGNRLQIKAEAQLLYDVASVLHSTSSIGAATKGAMGSLQAKQGLLLQLLENEHSRLIVWLFPVDATKDRSGKIGGARDVSEATVLKLVRTAWSIDPSLAVNLTTRYRSARIQDEVRGLLLQYPDKAINEPEALTILLGSSFPVDASAQLKFLLFWAAVNPITAITYFRPAYKNNPFILQYAMRALESHSVDVTFFYVPQIVQTLRYDALRYVERYIIETAQFSQLFAHQIIWNMKANAFKDEDSTIPDDIKPTLDKVTGRIISSFSGNDKVFYEREFRFFDEITGISGKLKPYIKRPKPEKKQKIEEELRKIKVEVGVYLPCNPDGVVVGIDRKSGKPLQSHAKAPYMATFRVKKNVNDDDMRGTDDLLQRSNRQGTTAQPETIEVWQSAIFKVGDDCRQDVLALQMIAAFRGIFNNVGLDVYVFPNRVTATAPGCGVIDVLPNSISRDMLGREAVNGLYDYFISKYGNEDSVLFQEARNSFVKSMAAYSVISFLLQFKDRHNGNIMIDDAGHILHIDFGFCFDIAPGGVKFERAPFKLTSEMVAVMGGNTETQSYQWFEQLCVKAFLASRQYTEKLSQMVLMMMDSGLPCFKPETMQHFLDRFVLEKSEREAAEFMRGLIKKSQHSYSTGVYDQFQLMTNGIPY